MSVTIDSSFRSAPRISRAGFVAVLERAGSFESDPLWAPTPRAERPAEAGRIYDLIASRGHDPAVFLAIAGKEHTWGTNRNSVLWRCNTRSWTNARSVRDPSLAGWEIVTDPVRRSQYVRYASVMDSVRDGLYRVDDPTFAYAGKTTILEIIQTWAPSADGNAPRAYAEQVARWINEWAVEFPPEGEAMTDDPQAQWAPSSNYTTGREGRKVDLIIIHSTEAPYESALNWLRGRPYSSNTGSSSHYLMDANGGRLVQMVREADTAWTAGNWEYNLRSVNIEMEGYAGRTPFSDALYRSCAALVARIAARHGIPLDRQHIIGHAEVPNQSHWDPGPLWQWDRFMALVDEAAGKVTPQSPDIREFPETGCVLGHGFLRFWEKYGGLLVFGYPITNEMQENGLTVQYFERARFEHHPHDGHGRPEDWHVVLGHVGRELLEARARIAELEAELARLREATAA